ncbi:hypothetical protein C8Q70DRAFT_88413 [Cubamyces menziesii]|nr:hypothetical protein C8Q70DRAFT_88413 [Cubamyces menziesii]
MKSMNVVSMLGQVLQWLTLALCILALQHHSRLSFYGPQAESRWDVCMQPVLAIDFHRGRQGRPGHYAPPVVAAESAPNSRACDAVPGVFNLEPPVQKCIRTQRYSAASSRLGGACGCCFFERTADVSCRSRRVRLGTENTSLVQCSAHNDFDQPNQRAEVWERRLVHSQLHRSPRYCSWRQHSIHTLSTLRLCILVQSARRPTCDVRFWPFCPRGASDQRAR